MHIRKPSSLFNDYMGHIEEERILRNEKYLLNDILCAYTSLILLLDIKLWCDILHDLMASGLSWRVSFGEYKY